MHLYKVHRLTKLVAEVEEQVQGVEEVVAVGAVAVGDDLGQNRIAGRLDISTRTLASGVSDSQYRSSRA